MYNNDLADIGKHLDLGLVSGSNNSQAFSVDLTQYKFIVIGHWYLHVNCNVSMMIPRKLFVDANEWNLLLGDEVRGTVKNTSNNGFTIETTSVMDNNWSIIVIGVK